MSESLKQLVRRRVLEQIQKRHDEMAARESRIREIAIMATTAVMQREAAIGRGAECTVGAAAELDALNRACDRSRGSVGYGRSDVARSDRLWADGSCGLRFSRQG